jgi:hypothetical protein
MSDPDLSPSNLANFSVSVARSALLHAEILRFCAVGKRRLPTLGFVRYDAGAAFERSEDCETRRCHANCAMIAAQKSGGGRSFKSEIFIPRINNLNLAIRGRESELAVEMSVVAGTTPAGLSPVREIFGGVSSCRVLFCVC